ncbi:biotin-dependent carboxyltransferase family protein [Rhodococcus sp. P1Y]|uniref:5-oxoprolinase subunit C family protein n=1 Tax=Rhodococcus sp. P1Y TaxID=1302308 RepID=UPI000EB2C045|nr:biotin-dependent carboxyltransferase family protein [Rhodococcus sp. P1Y]AYJ51360.1 biotin-dependent carboxyltransferase [Rhodococcus sp. P1Y]
MSSIEVLSPGALSTVQDRGRLGYSSIGVGRSGAADSDAHDTANRLVGNMLGAATVETTLGGLRIRAHGPVVTAATGARAPVTINGVGDAMHCTLNLADGDELFIGTAISGLRTYLAVRGGIDVEPVLGSRSTDTMAELGPAPLAANDVLTIGRESTDWPAASWAPPRIDSGPIRVILGPRDDWFADASALFGQEWTVTSEADRVGVRLDGVAPLERSGTAELPSEGMVVGALQVPPDGQPVVFLADHPVTGGYPVIGVVTSADLPRLGQLRPGDVVRFAPVRA